MNTERSQRKGRAVPEESAKWTNAVRPESRSGRTVTSGREAGETLAGLVVTSPGLVLSSDPGSSLAPPLTGYSCSFSRAEQWRSLPGFQIRSPRWEQSGLRSWLRAAGPGATWYQGQGASQAASPSPFLLLMRSLSAQKRMLKGRGGGWGRKEGGGRCQCCDSAQPLPSV